MKLFITFAWVPGCGKSPIANYVSINFGIPILNNDFLRAEVVENLWYFDEKEHKNRFWARLDLALSKNDILIWDFSVDRKWDELKEKLIEKDFKFFIISFDLSRKFIESLYRNKKYDIYFDWLEKYLLEHEKFVQTYKEDIWFVINEENYWERLKLSLKEIENKI